MLAITHFALGLTIAVLFLVPAIDRFEDSTILVMSGLWGLGPDIGHFLPIDLHGSLWSNVFWLHPTLDAFETAYPNAEALVALLTLAFAVVLVERRVERKV